MARIFIVGIRAHIYGSSPSNQRIEGWWSWSHWWINFFKNLIQQGHLITANMLEAECLWFSFSNLLQKELDEVQHHWNTHYIRRSRHDTLAGRPNELYYLPENVDAENHVKVVEDEKLCDMLNYICSVNLKSTLITMNTLQVSLPKLDLGNLILAMKH